MAGNTERIIHLKKKLEREVDKDKILSALNELNKFSMTVDYLEKTGIGKTVRGLRKKTGEIGKISNNLYSKWKQIAGQRSSDVNKIVKRDSKDVSNISRTLTVEREDSYTVYDSEENELMPHCKKKLNNDIGNFNLISSKSKRTGVEINSKKSSVNGGAVDKSEHKNRKFVENTKVKGEDGKKNNSEREKSKVNSHSSPSKDKHKSKKRRLSKSGEGGFDSTMVSFEDCLGLGDYKNSGKKKTNSPVAMSPQKTVKTSPVKSSPAKTKVKPESSSTNSKKTPPQVDKKSLLEIDFPLPPLTAVDISSTLPSIQPNYKPMRFTVLDEAPRKRKPHVEIDPTVFMSSKHTKTQVFSGRRVNSSNEVPSLYELCIRVIQDNIDALEFTGGVPYEQLKPVLVRCTPQQLYQIEDYNPYLLQDTDALWTAHCKQDFKKQEPDELETWREFYLRKYDEREAKLKSITANISASMAKALPVRQTKLAYVDTVAKPPRSIARRQAKFGTGTSASEQKGGPPPIKISHKHVAASSNSSDPGASGSKVPVKKIAPLMQKTLKFMKNRFRR